MIFDNFLATSKHKKGILKVEVVSMKDAYKKSLQMIKEQNKMLTEKQYTKLAKENNLLNIVSIEFISRKSFNRLVKSIIE